MYLRPVHTDLDLPTLYAFIQQNPLGILTTAIPSPNFPTIQSSHIPWVLDIPSQPPSTDDDNDADEKEPSAPPVVATLRGHLARANPQTKVFIEHLISSQRLTSSSSSPKNGILEEEVMILFNGPIHHYVTPKFYTTTKPSTGKVVPTWNYSAVEAYGKAKIYLDTSDASTSSFLATQINDLSKQSEEKIMGYDGLEGRKKAWSVRDAPERYVELLKKAILGVEIRVERLAGKWKMSQELGEGDREGTIEGFEAMGTREGVEMARLVGERAEIAKVRKAVVSS